MEKISKTLKNPFVLAIALNLIPLLVYLAFGSGKFDSLDDYFMSSVLTGAYGSEYDVHLYFVNVIFGYALKPFYLLFPTVGWYYIFEIGAAFVSFSAITYVLLKRCGYGGGLVLSSLILTTVAPEFYFGMNFTQCAEILTAAGMLLAVVGSFDKNYLWMAFGVVFLLGGYTMRTDAFLMSVPFIMAMFVGCAIEKRKLSREIIIVGLCSFFMILGVKKVNQDSYVEDEYKAYAAFQGPRATLGDSRYYDYDAAFSELQEKNFSGNDLRAARNWMFYDTEIFSVSGVLPILKAIQNNRYDLNLKRTLVCIGFLFSKSLWTTLALCWFLLGLFLILRSKGLIRLLPWISMGLMVLCYGYLLYVNRIVHHVEAGVWLYGSVLFLPFYNKKFGNFALSKEMHVVFLMFIGLMFAFSVFSTSDIQESIVKKNLEERKNDIGVFLKYAESHPEAAFFVPFELYKSLASFYNDNAFKSVKPGSWQNLFPLGYWNIYLPGMVSELDKRNIENPLKDIVNENVLYVQEHDALMFGPQSVWEEHYKKNLVADTIQRFGRIELLKYSIAGGNDEN